MCQAILCIAEKVLKDGFYLLSEVFRSAFPGQTYRTHNALERFLQMPLVALRVGTPSSGTSAWYILEHMEGVNLAHLLHFIEALLSARSLTSDAPSIDRKEIGAILSLAQSDRERELIMYTAFKASSLTATAAKRHLGFHNMTERCDKVQACIEEAQNIRETIDKLSHVQDRALLLSMGFANLSSSDSDTGSEIGDILVSSPGFSPNHTASVSMHSRSFLSSPSFPPVSSGSGPSQLSPPPYGSGSGPSPSPLSLQMAVAVVPVHSLSLQMAVAVVPVHSLPLHMAVAVVPVPVHSLSLQMAVAVVPVHSLSLQMAVGINTMVSVTFMLH